VPDTLRPWAGRAWWLAPVCLGTVLVLDAQRARAPSYLVLGLLDEPAHLLTTSIAVLAVLAVATWRGGRAEPAFAVAALAAGNLIDADHLPQVLGTDVLTRGTARPYPHSLATVALLLAAAPAVGGRAAAALRGAAFGVAVHLVRDVGTSPVALLWPGSSRGFEVPHREYATALVAVTAVAVLASRLTARARPARGTPPERRAGA